MKNKITVGEPDARRVADLAVGEMFYWQDPANTYMRESGGRYIHLRTGTSYPVAECQSCLPVTIVKKVTIERSE